MARPQVARFFRLAPFGEGEDPYAAPGAFKGPCGAPPWTFRRARQNLIWIYGFGLVFLIFAVADLTEKTDVAEVIISGTLITVLAFMYLGTAWVSDTSLWTRWCYIAAFLVVLATSIPVWGWDFANYGVYLAIQLATLIPWRQARIAIPLWGLVLVAMAGMSQTWTPAYIALIGVSVGLATGGGIEAGRVSSKLHRAEQRVSVLAVAAERERIGRDLHDILGHSLTAISIKSALAARLVDQDPAAAKRQLDEIEEVARQALADVRATASGFREVRVATEIASARSILLAAGIEARVPSAIEPLSDRVSELFGYVVREAVTNVVRHSEATTCTIEVDATQIVVTDDGSGFVRTGKGSGLAGLTERVQAHGGQLVVTSVLGQGTELRALLTPAESSADRGRPALAR